jgi:hypothetical protein
MISALSCKIKSLEEIDNYCTKEIEPLLLKKKGQPLYFGKYNSNGTYMGSIRKVYAKDVPRMEYITPTPVSPWDIKDYLESLGYIVEWVQVSENYPAGFSSSRRTCYYSSGYLTYYSLKISIK